MTATTAGRCPREATRLIEGRTTTPAGQAGPLMLAIAACDHEPHRAAAARGIRAAGLDRRDTTPRVPMRCGDVIDHRADDHTTTPSPKPTVGGRIECPGCAHRCAITPSGRLRHHGFPAIPGVRGYITCPWSGRTAADAHAELVRSTGGLEVVLVPVRSLPARRDQPA